MTGWTIEITATIRVRPAGVQMGNGEQPRRGRPSRSVETIELVKRLAAYHGQRLTLDQVATAAIREGVVKEGRVQHRRGVIRRHLAAVDLDGIEVEGL